MDVRAESKKNEKGELGDYFAVKNEYGEVVNFKGSLLIDMVVDTICNCFSGP